MKTEREIRKLRDLTRSLLLSDDECDALPELERAVQMTGRAIVDHLSWVLEEPPEFGRIDPEQLEQDTKDLERTQTPIAILRMRNPFDF